MERNFWGYMGKILRVDLTRGLVTEEPLDQEMAETYLGGSGFGVEYLYREVPPDIQWNDPENRIIMASGPVGGTHLSGAGSFSLVTKGPMTNLAVSTQANGFWGAFIKFAGYDAVVIQGRSPQWVYLHIEDGKIELRDATPILGSDLWDMEEAIRQDTGASGMITVFGIGPGGENMVRYAIVGGDRGHISSKNGCGAVMGAKRLKAVSILRGRQKVPVYNKALLREKSRLLLEDAKQDRNGLIWNWGTGGSFSRLANTGQLPIRNYTTNIFPEHENMNGQYMREHFEHKNKPCWACGMLHTKYMKVTEGPYAGYEGEEPEYECMAAWGPLIGNTDPGAVLMLSDLTDRLGIDVNEAGWVVGWVMECYERGILSRNDLDGLDMSWGNVEAVRELLIKISKREGIGNLLAEGVMRASAEIGGDAPDIGVYVLKGATPRGHDHRARWHEMLETCVSATGTTQSLTHLTNPVFFDQPPVTNVFSPWEVAGANARVDGWFIFLDSLPICRFITTNPQLTMDCLNAVTGRDLQVADALTIGRRVINQLRVFNFMHGLDPRLEVPSPRYGSTPVDGPAAGKTIMPHFQWMKGFYFQLMGWDPETGKPLPHTLKSIGLEKLIPDLNEISEA